MCRNDFFDFRKETVDDFCKNDGPYSYWYDCDEDGMFRVYQNNADEEPEQLFFSASIEEVVGFLYACCLLDRKNILNGKTLKESVL